MTSAMWTSSVHAGQMLAMQLVIESQPQWHKTMKKTHMLHAAQSSALHTAMPSN